MSEADARALANHKKRRSVVRASLTRLGNKLSELEDAIDHPDTLDHVWLLALYKSHHYAIVDLTDGEEVLATEQEVFDADDETITQLSSLHDKDLFQTTRVRCSQDSIKAALTAEDHTVDRPRVDCLYIIRR